MAAARSGRPGDRRVDLGRVMAHFGLDGWLKIESYTEPRERIFGYRPLNCGDRVLEEFEGKAHGRGLLLRIAGCRDREAVDELIGRKLWVRREQLPAAAPGEYYWSDLEGCRVVNRGGHDFGRVKRLVATGANDVLVVENRRETLIPFVQGTYVLEVDLERRRVLVDWEPEFL